MGDGTSKQTGTHADTGEAVALSALVPDPRNARRHGAHNLYLIERSLRGVGAARLIVFAAVYAVRVPQNATEPDISGPHG